MKLGNLSAGSAMAINLSGKPGGGKKFGPWAPRSSGAFSSQNTASIPTTHQNKKSTVATVYIWHIQSPHQTK
jgi:hypothetical protein